MKDNFQSDESLILEAQSSSNGLMEKNFTILYTKYQEIIKKFISFKIHNPNDVDDLVQETFIKMYKHIDKYRDIGKFNTWLYTIAENVCNDYFKFKIIKQKNLEFFDPNDELNQNYLIDTLNGNSIYEPSQLQELLKKEKYGIIEREIEKLSKKDAGLLKIVFHEEIFMGILAKEFKIPEGTVKSRIHNGKKLLRERLTLNLNY